MLEALGVVRVTNAGYGDGVDAADYTYRVTVESGVSVACKCPADTYHAGCASTASPSRSAAPCLRPALTTNSDVHWLATHDRT